MSVFCFEFSNDLILIISLTGRYFMNLPARPKIRAPVLPEGRLLARILGHQQDLLGINSGDYRIIAYCIIKLHFLSHGAKDTSDFAAAPSTSHCYCVSIPDCYSKYLHRTIFQDIYLFSYQFRTSHVHSSLVSKKN